jgi:hypothetical protein
LGKQLGQMAAVSGHDVSTTTDDTSDGLSSKNRFSHTLHLLYTIIEIYRQERLDYERSLVEGHEDLAEALKHLQSKTWKKKVKKDIAAELNREGVLPSPVDESGNWRGRERAADIACIDLEDVKDNIVEARKRMRLFIQNNPGDIDPKIKQWTCVDVEETEDTVDETA